MKLWLWILAVLVLQSAALAQTQIRFTNRELSAGAVLMKPELNTLELDDQSGTFTPGPSLRAIGVDQLKFDIDFSGVSQLAGIHFNHLKGKTPELRFEGNRLYLIAPIQDQERAARSVLGTVSLKNVVIRVGLAFRQRTNGAPELYVTSTGFSGTMTGTGAFRPSFMMALLQKLMLKTVGDQATKVISRQSIQDAIYRGLLGWAKFYTGESWQEITPGSPEFYTEGTESGLRYSVQ